MRSIFLTIPVAILACSLGASAESSTGVAPAVRATFKLFNEASTATCFLVHRDEAPEKPILVTSAHVFEKMKGEEAILVLRKQKDDGSYARHDFKFPVRKGETALWSKHKKHDIAVLALASKPEGVECPSIALSQIADEKTIIGSGLNVSSRVFILTYPERFEANKAGFPITRGATVASYPLTPIEHNPSFIADFSAFGGDSGGPVLFMGTKDGPPLVVGIAVAQFRHDEKLKQLNEERTVHHPLGLSKILHAQFIRETIALLDELED